MTIQQAFKLAVQHHQSGRLPEAEAIYRQILAAEPRHADSLHLLGVIAHQVGRNDVAVDAIAQAIALLPRTPSFHCNLGSVLQDKGQLDEAITAYRQAISLEPNYAEAHNNLGTALQDKGQLDEAITAYRQAISLEPNYAEAHNNLGNVLRDKGQLAEAIAACRQAITLKPSNPEAHNNLGNALQDKGQVDEAIAAYRQAIALRPNYAEAHSNLGNVLRNKGQLDEAIAAYRQAIALKPDNPEAHNNLGSALRNKGQLDEAISACGQAIALRPNYAEAHSNLGNVLRNKGEVDEAIAAYRQAIALKPNNPEAHNNVGNALRDKGQLDEAITCCRQAIALRPNYAEGYNNLGNALRDKGQLDESIAAYRQAIAFKSNYPEAHSNLGAAWSDKGQLDESIASHRQAIALKPSYPEAHSNLGTVLKEMGQLDEAIAEYRQAIALRPDYPEAHSNVVLTLHYHPDFAARAIAEEERRWNQQHAEPLRQCIEPHGNDPAPDRRLRIGYVSPDLRAHSVGRFLLPLLTRHDRQKFEIYCYAQVPAPDAMTHELRAYADHWHSIVGLTDQQAATLIREHQIDILVDLALHTAHHRLLVFARKPAPVQVTYLAYAGSSGLRTMDYRLSDPYLDPLGGDESTYSEETIRLPETYWCYQPNIAPLEPSPLPALARGVITFGCLNNFCKVGEPALAAWSTLLRAFPDSRLLLHAPEGSHRQGVWQRLQREGIEPARVRFVGKLPLTDYFRLYHEIDLALDPFPYGGGTTTCDALWMGVPVVTLAGKTAVGRGGRSILTNLGMPELVAQTEEEYVRIATALADDLPRLGHLRSALRRRMEESPLMDAPRFARSVEAAYREMWRQWCLEEEPAVP